MDLLFGIGLIIVIWMWSKATEWEFDKYTPPKGQRIDCNKQALDRVQNHLTNEQVMRNTINGKYNTKDFM